MTQPVIQERILQTVARNDFALLASTTTPLGISGVWSSDFIDVRNYRYLKGGLNADALGTVVILFSADGVNTLFIQSTVFSYGTDGLGIQSPVLTPYVKFQYTNGGTAQTSFSLYIWGG